MIAIEKHLLPFYFLDRERAHLTFPVPALQLAAHFHPGRELAASNGLHKIFVTRTERVLRLQIKLDLVAGALPFQRFFDLRQDVAIATVQRGRRLIAVLKHLTVQVRHLKRTVTAVFYLIFMY